MMKKFFCIFSIAALAFAACTKETVAPEDENGKTPSEGVTITFACEAPMPPIEDGSKTTVDASGLVAWEAGDEIAVWYLDSNNEPQSVTATAASAGNSTTFTATITDGSAPDHFWAAYPAGSGSLTYEGGNENFAITVTNSDGTFKGANFMAAYSTAEAMSFAFKNAVGIVKIALPAGGVISHGGTDYTLNGVRIRGKSSGINHKGTVEVLLNSENSAVESFSSEVTGGAGNIYVNFGDEVRNDGFVYLPSLPGTLGDGFGVKYFAQGGKNIPGIVSKDAEVTFSRGHIKPLSDLTGKIVWDYYVSPSGSGDGLSVASPMSIDGLYTLLYSRRNDSDAVYMAYANVLNGVTVHFEEGNYTVSQTLPLTGYTEEVEITFDGNAAILDGDDAVGLLNITAKVNMHVRNMTFQHGMVTTQGGAVRLDRKDSKLDFTGCSFKNNSAVNGGAIAVVGAASSTDEDLQVSFTNCLFASNTATAPTSGTTGGAAVLVSSGTGGGIVSFNNCRFDQNTAPQGASFFTSSKVASYFNGCTFYFEQATGTASGIGGYSVYSGNKDGRLGMNNCTIHAKNRDNANGINAASNGAQIRTIGYSAIANTTIWSSGATGNRASLIAGRGPSIAGATPQDNTVVNCVVHQKSNTYNALFFHDNYTCQVLYSFYDGINGTLKDGVQVVTGCHNWGEKNNTAPTGAAGNPNKPYQGVNHTYYTWTFSAAMYPDFTPATLGYVKDAIKNTNGVGQGFYNWLEDIGALDKDIMGRSRGSSDSDLQSPGSYHMTWVQ
ncbi:MAG: hypothetical protein IJS62_00515 [Bacteroidales bacterium]|nr:hypothetical protein [Bacteroidales bacterium]